MHEHDVADVAALLEDGHQGVACTINGPELISRRAQVAAIAAAIGHDIRLEVVTPARAREMYLAQGGFAAANADFLTGFADYAGNRAEPLPVASRPRPTVEDVTGVPARTFAQWARDHAGDFA